MRLVIRPIQDKHRELDVTHRLVSAIAEELWRLYGGNETLNWIEAELHLQRIVGEAREASGRSETGAVTGPLGSAATAEQTAGARLGRQSRRQSTIRSAPGRGDRRACAERLASGRTESGQSPDTPAAQQNHRTTNTSRG